jgi:excisionase family DNA binding protein
LRRNDPNKRQGPGNLTPTKIHMMKRFLTSKEAADYLGIAENELADLSKTHQITAYKIGGIYTRFNVDDIEIYRRKGITKNNKSYNSNAADYIRDFFYFNDFYIYSGIIIAVMLYYILKKP